MRREYGHISIEIPEGESPGYIRPGFGTIVYAKLGEMKVPIRGVRSVRIEVDCKAVVSATIEVLSCEISPEILAFLNDIKVVKPPFGMRVEILRGRIELFFGKLFNLRFKRLVRRGK